MRPRPAEYWLTPSDLTRAEEYAQVLLSNSTAHGAAKYVSVAHKLLGEIALPHPGGFWRSRRDLTGGSSAWQLPLHHVSGMVHFADRAVDVRCHPQPGVLRVRHHRCQDAVLAPQCVVNLLRVDAVECQKPDTARLRRVRAVQDFAFRILRQPVRPAVAQIAQTRGFPGDPDVLAENQCFTYCGEIGGWVCADFFELANILVLTLVGGHE